MNFSVVICTFMRPHPTMTLLQSINSQSLLPSEVIVVDSSFDDETKSLVLKSNPPFGLRYFKVSDEHRGLTKQRNFGISKVRLDVDIVAFLDDDLVLEADYFKEVVKVFLHEKDVVGVGGITTNEVQWTKKSGNIKFGEYEFDGYVRKLSGRNLIRKLLRLDPDCPPFRIPTYSHGFASLPPTGMTYKVEHLLGGIASFRRDVLLKVKFSHFFEGYGLYEDFDFSVRISLFGQLYINTAARVAHYHAAGGRPNRYRYGRMVVWNGWYVWRLRHPDPGFRSIIKWHAITLLLTIIRLLNAICSSDRSGAFAEFMGRSASYLKLFVQKPKIESN